MLNIRFLFVKALINLCLELICIYLLINAQLNDLLFCRLADDAKSDEASVSKMKASFTLMGMEYHDDHRQKFVGTVEYKKKNIRFQNRQLKILKDKRPKHIHFDDDGNAIPSSDGVGNILYPDCMMSHFNYGQVDYMENAIFMQCRWFDCLYLLSCGRGKPVYGGASKIFNI